VVEFNQQVLDRNQALPEAERVNVTAYEFQRDTQTKALQDFDQTAQQLRWWQRLMVGVKTPLPKTNETVDLMTRWLVEEDPLLRVQQEEEDRRQRRRARRGMPTTRDTDRLGQLAETPEVTRRVHQALGARRVVWIIGSSLGFEAFILALGAWVFCRRDY
jgi:hypothetical protein